MPRFPRDAIECVGIHPFRVGRNAERRLEFATFRECGMLRSFILPAIAAITLLFATWHVISRQQPVVQSPPPFAPATSPYPNRVAGAGIIESRTENIAIGSHLPGIVETVSVKVGQKVRPGDPLFVLDTRQIRTEVKLQEAKLAAAQAQFQRLADEPRKEDIPPAEAALRQAAAQVAQIEDEFKRMDRLIKSDAATESQLVSSRERLAAAKAQFDRSDAELKRLLAGAWEADKAVSRAGILQAQAELEQRQIEQERHRVLTPTVPTSDAPELEVLQVNVRPGEAVDTMAGRSLIVLGDVRQKRVRVDIDEHDVPRFQPESRASGKVRGDSQTEYPLRFVRVEPYIIPKRSLTGDNTERVDTRVLQVIYEIEKGTENVFVGQQMDVFVEAAAAQ